MNHNLAAGQRRGQTEEDVKDRPTVKKPPRFRVIIHNDDFTPINFVAQVIMTVFGKRPDEASGLALAIHYKGSAVCGIYTFDIAETKTAAVMTLAQSEGFPLQCTFEEDR